MNIELTSLSYSSSGGAGQVASSLHTHFSKINNITSNFEHLTESNLRQEPFQDSNLLLTTILDNYLIKKQNFEPLFSLCRGINSKTKLLSNIKSDSILHIHWGTGLINEKTKKAILSLKLKIIWTLHDMEPYTGGCHYSMDCKNYAIACSNCPAVKAIFRKKVENNFNEKMRFLGILENMIFVSPSLWGKNKIGQNPSLRNKEVYVIPNPVDEIFFHSQERTVIRREMNISESDFVIGFVADSIDNPLKNFKEFASIITKLKIGKNQKVTILIIGQFKEKYFFRPDVKVIYLNRIYDKIKLKSYYTCFDILLSTSKAETFGLTIAESNAVGTIALVRAGTAAEELVKDFETGFIYHDIDLACKIIEDLMVNESKRLNMGEIAKIQANKIWRINTVGQQYIDLYLKMLSKNKDNN